MTTTKELINSIPPTGWVHITKGAMDLGVITAEVDQAPVREGIKLPGSIFIHIPKTAGISIKSLPPFQSSWFGHSSVSGIISLIGEDMWTSMFSFTVVRNPYDRALSMWSYSKTHRDNPLAFERWLSSSDEQLDSNSMVHTPQIAWLAHNGEIKVNLILRFEDLAKNWPGLPHSNKSEHRPDDWKTAYNPYTANLVTERYQADFEHLGYDTFSPI